MINNTKGPYSISSLFGTSGELSLAQSVGKSYIELSQFIQIILSLDSNREYTHQDLQEVFRKKNH